MVSPRQQQGFTLIEILVVVVLISVIVSVMLLSIDLSSPSRRLEAVADKLTQQMHLAYQSAVLQQRELGFSITEQGYLFLEYQEGEWIPPFEKLLQPEVWPEPLERTLILDEKAVAPMSMKEPVAQVLILSSGEMTPFLLELRDRDNDWQARLSGDFLGRLEQQLESPQ